MARELKTRLYVRSGGVRIDRLIEAYQAANVVKQSPRHHYILRAHEDGEVEHLGAIVFIVLISRAYLQLLEQYLGLYLLLDFPQETTQQHSVQHIHDGDDKPDATAAYFLLHVYKFVTLLALVGQVLGESRSENVEV